MKVKLLKTWAFCLIYTFAYSQNHELQQPDSVRFAKIGMPVPYFKVLAVEEQNLLMYEPSDFCGKVAIIEMWSSKNQSSSRVVSHYSQLKNHFKEKIEILLVTDEPLEVIQKFVARNHTSVSFAIDPDKKIKGLFPHTTMPHATLIDTDGYIRAITYPEEISASTITKLLENQSITYKLKSELQEGQEPIFAGALPNEPVYKCLIKPFDPDKGISYEWLSNNEFIFTNFALKALYQSLYGISPVRIINESKRAEWYQKNHNSFVTFEMKVPFMKKSEIVKEAIEHLHKALPLKSKLEYRDRKGYFLERVMKAESGGVNAEMSQKSALIGNHLEVNGLTIRTLRDFIKVLEDYELVDAPIKNDTDYFMDTPVSIEALPTKPAELANALNKYGFALVEKTFSTEYLILYEE